MQAAQTGNTAPLLKLADGGNADAQYYAGVMFIFGSKMVLKDAARGCAYEEKASKTRGDAMHLTGMCHQSGADGRPDLPKAEAAYRRAAEMGFIKSKCALGQILMADPPRAKEGLELCEAAGKAGDVEAQLAVANAYFAGAAGKSPDLGQARWWYEKAASQNSPNAMRRLGEMYARGDGGPKDTKKAIQLWTAAEQAGDPLVAILMADQLFAEMTGGRKPGPGTYGFRGGVPVADIEVVEQWYKLAQAKDPRPDVQERARYGLAILANFKTAAGVSAKRTNRR
ncbi:MAG: hypothetical protein ABW042_06680 [Phenylobacterium sp.]